jgi:fibronectin type 3 domain-containing protein
LGCAHEIGVPVAGYNVYRSPSGVSTYQLLNLSIDTQTAYMDETVQNGQTYDYIVESVDDYGVGSVPTSPVAVTIP